MAKYIRAVRLPAGDLVTIEAIIAVKKFDSGVGLLDLRNRMIGWVDIDGDDEGVRAERFSKTLEIFDALINDRRRAQQPEWSFLQETALPKKKQATATASPT